MMPDQASGQDAEQEQRRPGVEGEQGQEAAAEVQAEGELEEHQADGAVGALAERVIKDDARVAGIQALVDAECTRQRRPDHQTVAQDQRLHGNRQKEEPVEVQQEARLVGRFEGQGGQHHIGETEQNSGFTMLATKHPDTG